MTGTANQCRFFKLFFYKIQTVDLNISEPITVAFLKTQSKNERNCISNSSLKCRPFNHCFTLFNACFLAQSSHISLAVFVSQLQQSIGCTDKILSRFKQVWWLFFSRIQFTKHTVPKTKSTNHSLLNLSYFSISKLSDWQEKQNGVGWKQWVVNTQ